MQQSHEYLKPSDINSAGEVVSIRAVARVVSWRSFTKDDDAVARRRVPRTIDDHWLVTFYQYPNKPMQLDDDAISEIARITSDGLADNWLRVTVWLSVEGGSLKLGPTERGYMPAEYVRHEELPAPRFHDSRIKW